MIDTAADATGARGVKLGARQCSIQCEAEPIVEICAGDVIWCPPGRKHKAFGRAQSFVAGDATNVQFMVKNSIKYAATGGWRFAQFNAGTPVDAVGLGGCYACHVPVAGHDFVFTRYSP